MSTKIVLGMDGVTMQQASSNLEGRTNATFTKAGTNKRVLIKIPSIVVIEEDPDE